MISSIGVVAVSVWTCVAIRVRAMFFPCRLRQARVGRVSPGKFLPKEALELPQASAGSARPRSLAASRRRYARNRRPSLVCKICGIGRFGAPGRHLRGASAGPAETRRDLGAKRQIVGRVIIKGAAT